MGANVQTKGNFGKITFDENGEIAVKANVDLDGKLVGLEGSLKATRSGGTLAVSGEVGVVSAGTSIALDENGIDVTGSLGLGKSGSIGSLEASN